jgi:hypothetical protein
MIVIALLITTLFPISARELKLIRPALRAVILEKKTG